MILSIDIQSVISVPSSFAIAKKNVLLWIGATQKHIYERSCSPFFESLPQGYMSLMSAQSSCE